MTFAVSYTHTQICSVRTDYDEIPLTVLLSFSPNETTKFTITNSLHHSHLNHTGLAIYFFKVKCQNVS